MGVIRDPARVKKEKIGNPVETGSKQAMAHICCVGFRPLLQEKE
jgi:hypothetical protein